MGNVIIGVTISLDGFAEDRSGSVAPLYPDLDLLDQTETQRESVRRTGAVVMAWKEYAMVEDPDWYAGNYEYQAPIFVVCDRMPEKHPRETRALKFTFVTDGLAGAVRQAAAAAGQKDVTVIGSAATTRACLAEGLADELRVDIVPLHLHEGFRPFENLRDAPFRLERLRSVDLPAGRVHIEFRVLTPGEE